MDKFIKKYIFLCIIVITSCVFTSFTYASKQANYKIPYEVHVLLHNNYILYSFKGDFKKFKGVLIDQINICSNKTGISKSFPKNIENIIPKSGFYPNKNLIFLGYALVLLIIIMIVFFLLIFWNRLLNKKVKEKTTELTLLLHELNARKNNYKKLLSSLNIGVIVYSCKKEILLCNDAYLRLLKLPNKKYINEHFLNSVGYFFNEDEKLLPIDKYPTNIVLRTKKCVENYTIGIKRNPYENIIWVQVDSFPEFDENNNIISIVQTFVDITERKNAECNIYKMSIQDNLTGLNNRNYFENILDTYQEKNLSKTAMVFCDIDGLKLINDTLGHSVGDEYLCAIANILRSCFRKQDIISRIGGDEFGIIMENTSCKEIEKIRSDIHEIIKNINDHSNTVPLSISFGYEIYKKEHKNIRELYKIADNRMYMQKLHHHQSTKSELVNMLVEMLQVRDFITEGHGENLKNLSIKLAKSLNLSNNEIKDLSLLSQFHDIGKVGIADSILFKPGRLNKTEIETMKRHSEIGYNIAKSSPDLMRISDWIFKHHEWWNGNGYPLGLKGNDIPIQCRILSIVDTYDAMTNDRPYRKALKKEDALKEIQRCAGTQFDPTIANKFVSIMNNETV